MLDYSCLSIQWVTCFIMYLPWPVTFIFKGLFTEISGDLTEDQRQNAIGLPVSAGVRQRVCWRGRQERQCWDSDWNRPRDDLLMVRTSLDSYTGVTGSLKLISKTRKSVSIFISYFFIFIYIYSFVFIICIDFFY